MRPGAQAEEGRTWKPVLGAEDEDLVPGDGAGVRHHGLVVPLGVEVVSVSENSVTGGSHDEHARPGGTVRAACPESGAETLEYGETTQVADRHIPFDMFARFFPRLPGGMLTLTLRQLEREGLVRRTVFAVVPPRVDYELTPLGSTLLDTIQALVAWAGEHGHEVAAARAAYDARADAAPQVVG